VKQKSALFKYLVAPLTVGVFIFTFFTVVDAIRWEFTQKPRMLDSTALGEIILDRCDKSGGTGHRGVPVYQQYVEYNYQVNGKTLKSNRVSFYPFSDCKDFELPLTVYYDPLDPAYALLEVNEENGWQFLFTQIPFQLCVATGSGGLILMWAVEYWQNRLQSRNRKKND
jgi:hypothetical protein